MKYLILLLSFLGFLVSTYLTIQHYQQVIPPCTVGGCEVVLTSEFATVAGIPISLFGALYFIGLISIVIVLLQGENQKLSKILKFLIFSGFVVSVVLILVQAVILKAFCQYCMVVDSINILLFFLILRLNKA